MNITVPIYVEELRLKETAAVVYRTRPLFFTEPEERDANLNRAVTKLAKSLKREFDRAGAADSHQKLSAYSFCPEVEDRVFKLEFELARRRVLSRLLVVVFESLGRKIAFTPTVPDLWFEIARREQAQNRAVEVLTRHFREQEKKLDRELTEVEMSVQGRAWVTTLELDMHPPMAATQLADSRFAALGGSQPLDGAVELRSVGRCLDWLYPDDLDRSKCRERELADLTRLLKGSERRPVLLVGPRSVGKTALIHEYVFRRVSKKRSQYSEKKNVWLLSPQRLISGMIFVGQWENRLLAILERAHKQDHILYFDDLLGLFHAGLTRDSNLCAADLLKPYVEKREFRMLGEITPEAFRIFQERDRGFADMFQVVHLREPDERDTLQILMSVIRELERSHQCRFDFDVLAEVIGIHRRYVRDAAFPGKAALFLRQLAVRHQNEDITRDRALDEFHTRSGLSLSFLNHRSKLERREVVDALGKEVIGQTAALNAAADVVCVAKARLNDTNRPLASFLFLGPTGVGKTQAAKSLAAYLFGNAEKILRFDMNEYVSPASVARLVGTFDRPEGLLTSAVRRQPFSVVLFDEIEKADRDVFDLLLQVMGDGRLTDALGRTADFTNTILVLTSNLGVKEASSNLGFREGHSREGSAYLRAAEKFFKPEFFNRLDRIVPFERLRREDVQAIARTLIQEVFARDGLLRRRVVLQVDAPAMERIVDQGYHPTLGARALKRAIERQLTQPVASRLAAMKTDTPTIVSLKTRDGEIEVRVRAITGTGRQDPVAAIIELREPKIIIGNVEAAVARIEEGVDHLRLEGAIAPEEIQPEHQLYFAIKEQARRVKMLSERLSGQLSNPQKRFVSRSRGRHLPAGQLSLRQAASGDLWAEAMVDENTRGYLRELAASTAPYGERVEDHLADMVRETALLHMLAGDGSASRIERALICIRSFDEERRVQRTALAELYERVFEHQFGLKVNRLRNGGAGEFVEVIGLHAAELARVEEGTHLFIPGHGSLVPIQVSVAELFEGQTCEQAAGQAGSSEVSADDLSVIRIYEEEGVTLDLRSGLLTLRMPSAWELRALVLALLPLPEELME